MQSSSYNTSLYRVQLLLNVHPCPESQADKQLGIYQEPEKNKANVSRNSESAQDHWLCLSHSNLTLQELKNPSVQVPKASVLRTEVRSTKLRCYH